MDILQGFVVKPVFCPLCNDDIKCTDKCVNCAKNALAELKQHCKKRVVSEDEIVYYVGYVTFDFMLKQGVIRKCGNKYII